MNLNFDFWYSQYIIICRGNVALHWIMIELSTDSTKYFIWFATSHSEYVVILIGDPSIFCQFYIVTKFIITIIISFLVVRYHSEHPCRYSLIWYFLSVFIRLHTIMSFMWKLIPFHNILNLRHLRVSWNTRWKTWFENWREYEYKSWKILIISCELSFVVCCYP